MERGGVPYPAGLHTRLQRMDIISVVGLKGAVQELAQTLGRIARPSTATDLLTLAAGMILGFLIGMVEVPMFGSKVGLGNAGGLLLSGVIVSSAVSRLRYFGNTPNAARNILEDLGLVVFVAIVGVNAGNSLLAQLTGAIALKIFILGFIACSVPPFIVWAIGYHFFKINPAVLIGWRRRRAFALRPLPRSGGRDPEHGALDRLPGRLRAVGNPAHRVRISRDGPGTVTNGG
jgi:putative transport protein